MSGPVPQVYLKAGDDRTIRIGIRNPDNSARDITGETIEFRAAPTLGSSTPTISKTDGNGVEIVDADLGVVDVVFTSEDTEVLTGPLLFDLRVTAASGFTYTVDFSDGIGEPATFGVLRIERPLVTA